VYKSGAMVWRLREFHATLQGRSPSPGLRQGPSARQCGTQKGASARFLQEIEMRPINPSGQPRAVQAIAELNFCVNFHSIQKENIS